MAIRDGVVFPHTETILTFGRSKSVAGIEAANNGDRLVAFFTQKNSKAEATSADIYTFGTLARIEGIIRDEKVVHATVHGIARVRLESIETQTPIMTGRIAEIPGSADDSPEIQAFHRILATQFQKAINLGKMVEPRIIVRLMGELSNSDLADQIAYTLEIGTEKKQEILEIVDLRRRMTRVMEYLLQEIKVLELERKLSLQTQKKFDKSMREAVLRERKRTIEEELGEIEGEEDEGKELEKKLRDAHMPKVAFEKAKKELGRLKRLTPAHPEYGFLRTYLDWLTDMPWSVSTPNDVSIRKAAKILDEDHYGLKKVKERIVEYLAVMKLREKETRKKLKREKERVSGTTILCFVGPPGVGKTSIGKSIAKALGRKFIRASLGGVHDEAEIRGHRRTYVGALPGRIIQGIKEAGSNNPVFMLDEIDKIGSDFRGDPSAALLEALDPEQNSEFVDHYLETPFDLSKTMFITTGNILDTIPPALRDRMEVIVFPGYTEEEKFNIARRYLWAKQLEVNGLGGRRIKISDAAIYEIIRRYTREAGVRDLERNMASVCRKLARRIAEGKKYSPVVTKATVETYLGSRKFSETVLEQSDQIGMATGLAYTESGGDVLTVEVALMPGKGNLMLTGKLGKVMQESARAAFSYVRSRWQSLGLDKDFYKNYDVHIHVPEGAVPKDGPSAGITVTTALVSAFAKQPIRRDVGMTGEITLRGRVLEIGGIKEKVIAAHRVGLKTVVLPEENRKDLEDIPSSVKRDINFQFVEHMDEVLDIVLQKKKSQKKP